MLYDDIKKAYIVIATFECHFGVSLSLSLPSGRACSCSKFEE